MRTDDYHFNLNKAERELRRQAAEHRRQVLSAKRGERRGALKVVALSLLSSLFR